MSNIDAGGIDSELDSSTKKHNNELLVKVTWAFASFAMVFALVTVIWMFESELPDGFWIDLLFG